MLWRVRTTIRLDDDLLREAKATAARTGRTLTRFIEDALRQALTMSAGRSSAKPYRTPTFTSGVRPGVNLDSNADLLDVMESG
jgi:Arc/MetJ family transcription regulator